MWIIPYVVPKFRSLSLRIEIKKGISTFQTGIIFQDFLIRRMVELSEICWYRVPKSVRPWITLRKILLLRSSQLL